MLRVRKRVIRVGAKFVNICSSLKAERNPCREALKRAQATSNARDAERGGFAMTAVPSNADVKKASLEAFTHALGMSAFV